MTGMQAQALAKTSAKSTYGLLDALINQAETRPSQTAIVHGPERISYSVLAERTAAVANQLRSLGIKKGDRVGLLFPNHADFVACFFGILTIGAVIVPVNPLLKSDEIIHILSDSGATAFIVHSVGLSESQAALSQLTGLQHLLIAQDTDANGVEPELDASSLNLASGIAVHKLSMRTAIVASLSSVAEPIDVLADLALIMYTSGTTGKPKGAMLTHSNLLSVGPSPLLDNLDISHTDRCLAVLPMCHVYGVAVIIFSILAKGGTIIVLQKFDPKQVLQLIEEERITLVPAVPSMYQFMIMELANQKYDVSSVRLCFSGAAPLPTLLYGRIETTFASPVIEGYGLTETACGGTLNPIWKRKIGSIGTALAGIDIRVNGPDNNELPSGEENIGEIAVRGANVMIGYHNQPEATKEAMQNGWFLTGDLGYKDEEGYFYIAGRKKELIIRGGQNIYPREIEEVIVKMPQVREVAVIGVPDDYMGERVKAIVVVDRDTSLTEDVIKGHCAKHLASYKVPRLVELRHDPLPRNSTGKVLKRTLG